MNSVKLNKKHLFSIFVVLVLLFALNINSFASNNLVSFYDYNFQAFYQTDNGAVNCTDSTTKVKSSNYTADNGRYYTEYVFTVGGLHDRSLATGADLNIYLDTEYEYNFQFYVSGASCPTDIGISLFFASTSGESSIITLYDSENLNSRTWHTVSSKFKTPNFSGTVSCAMLVQLRSNVNSAGVSGSVFRLSDMYISPIGPLYGEPVITPDTDDLEHSINNYDEIVNSLPEIDGNLLNDIMNFDFSSFTDGMFFVSNLFDRLMSLLGFNTVLVFSLTIGFVTYVIGRKVG